MGSNANEKNITSITYRAAFSDAVDWSALLIDFWEAPGWLISEVGQSRRFDGLPMISGFPRCADGSELARTFFTSQVGRCGRVFGL